MIRNLLKMLLIASIAGIFIQCSTSGTGNGKEENVSVWKKDNEGNWKFVLDTGNEGLSEQQ